METEGSRGSGLFWCERYEPNCHYPPSPSFVHPRSVRNRLEDPYLQDGNRQTTIKDTPPVVTIALRTYIPSSLVSYKK